MTDHEPRADYVLRKLSAWELLTIRREAAGRDCADEGERAVFANGALLARSLTREGEPAFADAEAVLNALGAGELNRLVAEYAVLDGGTGAWYSSGENGSFDLERFERMKKGRRA